MGDSKGGVSFYGFMPSIPSCMYNSGVDCDEQDIPNKCKKCGWNPDVANQRKFELRMKLEGLYIEKEAKKNESVLQEGTCG